MSAKSNVNIASKERALQHFPFPILLTSKVTPPKTSPPAIAACLVWLHISTTQPHISSDQGEKIVVIVRISSYED